MKTKLERKTCKHTHTQIYNIRCSLVQIQYIKLSSQCINQLEAIAIDTRNGVGDANILSTQPCLKLYMYIQSNQTNNDVRGELFM